MDKARVYFEYDECFAFFDAIYIQRAVIRKIAFKKFQYVAKVGFGCVLFMLHVSLFNLCHISYKSLS